MKDDCLFCRIAAGVILSDKLFEDDEVLAFRDIAPQAPVHVLIIPKKHIDSAQALSRGDDALMGRMLEVARQIADECGVSEGYRLVSNVGEDGGQSVKHLHLHLLGGRAMAWPPG